VAENNQGVSSSASFARITFQTVNQPPVVSYSMLDQPVTVDQPFTFGLPQTLFTDPNGDPLTLRAYQGLNESVLPIGLAFDPVLGRFNGLLHQPASYLIQVQGIDPQGAFAATQFAIIAQSAKTILSTTGLSTALRNSIIGAVVSGTIGLGFFGARYYLNKRMTDNLRDALKVSDSETEKENDQWRRETLLPFAREFFDKFKTTGLCCYRGKTDTAGYLTSLTTLLTALNHHGVDTHLANLDMAERRHLINVTMREIEKELVDKPKCCSKLWFFKMTRPSFMHEQLDNTAAVIAKAISVRLQREKANHQQKNQVENVELASPRERKWLSF
jgi:hypothetical protein